MSFWGKGKKKIEEKPNAPWLQAMKTNRLLSGIVVFQLLVIAALGFSISALFPLKEIVPVIVEFQSGGNNFVVLAKAGEELSANLGVITREIRQYVVYRERVDKVTESDIRYPFVFGLSSPEVANTFKEVYGNTESGLFFKKGFKRDVVIKRDTPLARGIHQVSFITIDTIDGKEGEIKNEWVATIGYKFEEQEVSFEEKLLNPLGMVIEEYTLSRRRG